MLFDSGCMTPAQPIAEKYVAFADLPITKHVPADKVQRSSRTFQGSDTFDLGDIQMRLLKVARTKRQTSRQTGI